MVGTQELPCQPDYIISAEGRTVYGKINSLHKSKASVWVNFTPDYSESVLIYGPGDIRGFSSKATGTRVSSSFHPVASEVYTNRPYFMERIVSGAVDVYSVELRVTRQYKTGRRYFYRQSYLVIEDGQPTTLTTEAELANYVAAVGCGFKTADFSLEDHDVAVLFQRIATCQGYAYDTVVPHVDKPRLSRKIRWGLEAGAYGYEWDGTSPLLNDFTRRGSVRGLLGARASVTLSRHLETGLGLFYTNYSHGGSAPPRPNDTALGLASREVKFSHHQVGAELSARLTLPLGGGRTNLYALGTYRIGFSSGGRTDYTGAIEIEVCDGGRCEKREVDGIKIPVNATYNVGALSLTNLIQFTYGLGGRFTYRGVQPFVELRSSQPTTITNLVTAFRYREYGVHVGLDF